MMDLIADRMMALSSIDSLPAGTRVVYHVGYLPIDRSTKDHNGAPKSKEERKLADRVEHIGYTAWQLCQDGKACLTQRRIGAFCYEYIAIRSRSFRK